jgi:hypothetical protein
VLEKAATLMSESPHGLEPARAYVELAVTTRKWRQALNLLYGVSMQSSSIDGLATVFDVCLRYGKVSEASIVFGRLLEIPEAEQHWVIGLMANYPLRSVAARADWDPDVPLFR